MPRECQNCGDCHAAIILKNGLCGECRMDLKRPMPMPTWLQDIVDSCSESEKRQIREWIDSL